jgi:hypothetical protein
MKKLTVWMIGVIALLVAGCGGGGGGGGLSGGVGIFLTDDLNTGYDAVWVTLYKVELESVGGRTTVFDDPNGRVYNLRALNDGNPRYAFLGKSSVPEGTYTGVRFTLDDDVRIVPAGSSTGNDRKFADQYLDPADATRAILHLTFDSPKQLGAGSSDLVCDFVLASWTENGTKIENCLVDDAPASGLDDGDRHDEDEFKGAISGLSGSSPNFTFRLNFPGGRSVPVATDSSTAIFNNNGSPSPQLANGKRVEVRGVWNPALQAVLARSVKIKNQGENDDDDPHEVKGVAVDVNAEAGTFDVELGFAEGFFPTEMFVHVTTSEATRYFSNGGLLITRAQFFEALSLGGLRVEAEGVWNSGTNTLAAVKVKLEDEDDELEAEAKGAPNTINAEAGTFRIQLREWEGFSSHVGAQINVVTHAGTHFRDIEGENITKEAFFAQLATAQEVKAEGRFQDGTITASQVRIRERSGGTDGEAEAFGGPSNVNAGARTFDLTLVEWEGFNGSAGQVIHVVMQSGATFRGLDGESMSAEAFFQALATGHPVEAEGVWNSSTSTLTAHKAKLED